MDTFEKTISNFVSEQFPEFYQEQGEIFIAFVKKYYEWMESNSNPIYHARRLAEYRDIDETTTQFLLYFKEQYLKNINVDTVVDTRTLIKHSLDLYRSKGSERAIKLLFQAVFGRADTRIYYPGDDIFKLSDGKWFEPTYLETTMIEFPDVYTGKEIIGVTSKAKAFVEKIIRKNVNNKLTDVFYISNVKNDFQTGEKFRIASMTTYDIQTLPIILGSLTRVEVPTTGTGYNFKIGDRVAINSNNGYGGVGRIANVSTTVGTLNFNLIDGGYGFTTNSSVFISEKVLTVNTNTSYLLYDSVSQTIANISFTSSNGIIANNESIFTYYANNTVNGQGKVVYLDYSNTSAGYLKAVVISGNLNSNNIYTTANAIGITKTAFTNINAVANVVASNNNGSNSKIGIYNITNQFFANAQLSNGEFVTSISLGSGATFGIANNLLNSEYVTLNTDYVKNYLTKNLNSTDWGLRLGAPQTNLSIIIDNALNYSNLQFGTINNIINKNPGSSYNELPFIVVIEPISITYNRYNYILTYSGASGTFSNGEIVSQSATGGRGQIIASNSTSLTLKNLRLIKTFAPTSNSTTTLYGEGSGVTANCIVVDFDTTSMIEGNNVIMNNTLNISNGAASNLQVIGSGFGFINNEQVTITKDDIVAYGTAKVEKQGKGVGYYKRRGGFTSSEKKIYDGYYYQDFSYDIISSVELNKYKDLLKNVVHTAGFKFFGTVNHYQIINTYASTVKSKITLS